MIIFSLNSRDQFVIYVIIILLAALRIVICSSSNDGIETYTFQTFPKDVTALHFSCAESNMFATNCACHLKCTDSKCSNAKKICQKYNSSKGCKYMIIRGGTKNKIATLKRVPTADEADRYNISSLPTSLTTLSTPTWQTKQANVQLWNPTASFQHMVQRIGPPAERVLKTIFTPPPSQPLQSQQYCGKVYQQPDMPVTAKQTAQQSFLHRSISLVALSYHSPQTLLNSMRSWNDSGLLQFMAEKMIILNDPLPQEIGIALLYGFQIIQPKDIPNSKMGKLNVFTIGAAFYYALTIIKSDYLLFLENDFKMDIASSHISTQLELLGGAALLDSGIEIIRLNSRKYQGCGTFKDCNHHGINLDSQSSDDRKRNWFAFYCREKVGTAPYVSDCLQGPGQQPEYRCFTSWDTNWTLNAVLVKKITMLNKKYRIRDQVFKSLAEIGLEQYKRQDGFESVMAFSLPWQQWRVPICISYNGLFIHEEIETAA